jgi:4-carboxymuconolactone decarboxylase
MTHLPGVSDLAGTDPDLVEIVERFAVREVPADAPLAGDLAALLRLAVLVATGSFGQLRALLDTAIDDGVSPVALKEVAYASIPYVGLGRGVEAVRVINEVLTGRGVALPLPSQTTTTAQTRADRGLAVQEEIVGRERVQAMHAGAPADEAHIQRYLSTHCFGDHYTRGGLDVPTRELVTLALLVALGGADQQVAGHVRANLNVGNDRATLIAVVTRLLPDVGYPRTLNALRAIDEIAPPISPKESS